MRDLQTVYKENFFHHEYNQAVAQLAQGVSALFVLRSFQDQTG